MLFSKICFESFHQPFVWFTKVESTEKTKCYTCFMKTSTTLYQESLGSPKPILPAMPTKNLQVPHLINPRMIKSSPDRKTFTGVVKQGGKAKVEKSGKHCKTWLFHWKSKTKEWSLDVFRMIHGFRIPDPTNGQAVWSTWISWGECKGDSKPGTLSI